MSVGANDALLGCAMLDAIHVEDDVQRFLRRAGGASSRHSSTDKERANIALGFVAKLYALVRDTMAC